jgi:carotenoid 1,2-hydratase
MSLALSFDAAGQVQNITPPPRTALPGTAWRIPRATRSDARSCPTVQQTLEDGPFYARSLLATQLCGERATAVHESLCLQRWARPVVQAMLPFRMPRRG